jgi:hypothetical protein
MSDHEQATVRGRTYDRGPARRHTPLSPFDHERPVAATVRSRIDAHARLLDALQHAHERHLELVEQDRRTLLSSSCGRSACRHMSFFKRCPLTLGPTAATTRPPA